MNAAQDLLTLVLRIYRAAISPALTAMFGPLGFGCRFTPTCSQYALQAVRAHGALHGSALAARRLCRCHPWGGEGADPVPPAGLTPRASRSTSGAAQSGTAASVHPATRAPSCSLE